MQNETEFIHITQFETKNLLHTRYYLGNEKQIIDWKKISAKHMSDKDTVAKIYKEVFKSNQIKIDERPKLYYRGQKDGK